MRSLGGVALDTQNEPMTAVDLWRGTQVSAAFSGNSLLLNRSGADVAFGHLTKEDFEQLPPCSYVG